MDARTLLAAMEFSRARLLGSIEAIEKSGQDPARLLAWRPGPGRAHIAWQLMHCAATYHKYLNVGLRGSKVSDEALVAAYGGGSTPVDLNQPVLSAIKEKLASTYADLTAFVAALAPSDLDVKKVGPGGKERTVAESIILLTWHESHHQGQVHLTWNLYKSAHGMG
jgi:hypothetical protein